MVFASAGRRGGSSASETVKLVFSASDQASAVTSTVAKSVASVASAALQSRGAVIQFGDTILSVFNNAFGIVNNVLELFQRINAAVNSQVGQQYFAELSAAATSSLQGLASVESALSSINRLITDGSNASKRAAQSQSGPSIADPADLRKQADAQKAAAELAGQDFAENLQTSTTDQVSRLDALRAFGKNAIASAQKAGQQAADGFADLYQKGLGNARGIEQGLGAVTQQAVQQATQAGQEAGKEFSKSYAAESANFARQQFEQLTGASALVVSASKDVGQQAGASFSEGYDESALAAETLAELVESQNIAIDTASSAGSQAGQQFGTQYTTGVQTTASAQTAIQAAGSQAAAAAATQGASAGQQFGAQYSTAAQRSIGSTLSNLELSVSKFTKSSIEGIKGVQQTTGGLAAGLLSAGGSAGEPAEILRSTEEAVGGVADSLNQASFKIAFFYGSLQALQQFVVSGPFQLLIQQNVELREQLLSTQSSLVSTNRVLQNGIEIGDPTRAIQALEAPVEAAITKIRQDSLELVGVTSNDLIGVFNILTGQISAMGGGLQDAADLTISFSAALGTLGVPLEQARQELVSIAQAQVTSDSVLAKSIGLTNEQLRLWKQQGTLIDNINTRLEAFRAGNALAAQTIGGITSNLQEVVQETARVAGEPLVDPIVEKLGTLLAFLQANQGAIADEVSLVANNLLLAGESIVRTFTAIVESTGGILTSIPAFLSDSLVRIVRQLESAVKGTLAILQPFINILAELAERAQGFNPIFRLVIIFGVFTKALQTATVAFTSFGASVPFVGEAIDFFSIRLNPLLNTFFNLSKAVGGGGAAFLLLGQNLQSLPPVLDAVNSKLGIFGPLVTSVIPAISGFGIQLAAFAPTLAGLGISLSGVVTGGLNAIGTRFPVVTKAIQGTTGAALDLLKSTKLLEKFPILQGVDTILETFQQALLDAGDAGLSLGDAVQDTVGKVDLVTFANEKFVEISKQAGSQIAKQVTQYGLFGAGALLAVFAIDQLILKNEAVRETLVGVFDAVVAFGKGVLDFVQNPVIAVTAAIVGLVAIISSGLLPTITATIAKFITFGTTAATTAAKAVAGLQAQFVALTRSAIAAAASFAKFAIATVVQQFRNLQATIVLTSASIKQFGIAGFIRNLFAAGAATGGFGTAMNGLTAAFGKAALAAKGFIIATGPIALISVAVIALAEAWNTYNRIQKAATQATEDFNKKIDEQQTKLDNLKRARQEALGEEIETDSDESAFKGLEERVEKERSFLNKRVEDILNISFFAARAVGEGTSKIFGESGTKAVDSFFQRMIDGTDNGFAQFSLKIGQRLLTGENAFDFTGDEAEKTVEGQTKLLGTIGNTARETQVEINSLNRDYQTLVDQLNNGTITQEEFDKTLESLNESYDGTDQKLQSVIDTLDSLPATTGENQERIAALRAEYVALQEALAGGREAELAQKELPRLGSAYDQLSQKVFDAVEYIKTGTGETEIFGQKIDDVLKNIPSLLDQGFIDRDSAIEALEEIANNVNATAEQQLAAQQEINKIVQEGGEKRVQEVQREQQAIQRQRAEGNLTDLEAELKLTELKQKEYDTRLEALRENTRKSLELLQEQEQASLDGLNASISAIEEQRALVEQDFKFGTIDRKDRDKAIADLNAQEQSLLGRREETQAAFNARAEKLNRDAAKEEEKIANEAAESAAQAEKAIYDARIAELDRANQKLLDATQKAETERAVEIAKLRAAGTTDLEDAQIGIKELENRKQVIKEELAVEQARLKALEALDPLSDPEEEEARQAQIRQSRLKTQDFVKEGYELEAQLLEAQIQLIEQRLAEANRQIANDTEARTIELERQNQLIESLERSLESQSRLLQARADFAQTSADSLTSSLDAIAAGEQSEYRRQQIAQTTAAIKLQALQVQQEYELRSLELEQAQLELAKQRELAENRIAQAKAESELAIGQNEVQLAQERFSRGEISESELRGAELQQQRRQLELQGLREQRRFIEEDLVASREIFDIRRAGVELQQRGAQRQAQAELIGTLPPGVRQRAQAAFADQVAQEDFGFANARQLRESGQGFARQLAGQQFGIDGRVGIQSAFDPELEGLSNVAGGQGFALAQRQSARDFQSQFGQFATARQAPPPNAAPFQLPPELQGSGRGFGQPQTSPAGGFGQSELDRLLGAGVGVRTSQDGTQRFYKDGQEVDPNDFLNRFSEVRSRLGELSGERQGTAEQAIAIEAREVTVTGENISVELPETAFGGEAVRGADASQFEQRGLSLEARLEKEQFQYFVRREEALGRTLERLTEALSTQQGGDFSADVTVNADTADLADQIAKEVRSQMEQVFNQAQRLATAAR